MTRNAGVVGGGELLGLVFAFFGIGGLRQLVVGAVWRERLLGLHDGCTGSGTSKMGAGFHVNST